MKIATGMNLRPALKLARKLDCRVEPVRRTGELRVSHPAVDERVVLNRRRDSSPRALTVFLKKVLAEQVVEAA